MIIARHGEKLYANNIGLDSPLTSEGKENAKIKFQSYLKNIETCPKYIYSSPLLRCRETSNILQLEILNKFSIIVPIIIRVELGEYFGNRKEINYESITTETKNYYNNSLVKETFYTFQARVKKIKLDENSCYITHGLVIQTIIKLLIKKGSKYFNENIMKYPNECEGISYLNNEIRLL